MKILLLGGNGQVGWELRRTLLALGEVVCPERQQLDLSDIESLQYYLSSLNVDVIVNAAAYTAVDKAESETELADRINHIVPGLLAQAAKKNNALLIHYSTDYVFDGTKLGAYTEQDSPAPLGVYGSSKLDGENIIQQSACDYMIFRTSWVYAARGANFLLTIRRLAQQKTELGIVDDQVGAPTWARLIAQTTAFCLHQALMERRQESFKSDLYHLTAAGQTSWFGFAQAVLENLRTMTQDQLALQQLNPIPTSSYPTPAARPANSRLDLSYLEKQFELVMPEWDKTLKLCMQEFQK